MLCLAVFSMAAAWRCAPGNRFTCAGAVQVRVAGPLLLEWRMLVLLHIVLVLELCDLHGGLKYLEISYFKGQPTNLW